MAYAERVLLQPVTTKLGTLGRSKGYNLIATKEREQPKADSVTTLTLKFGFGM